MGLMMSFVLGCYITVPMFVAEERQAIPKGQEAPIERSWTHRIFGNGWSWLGFYLAALVMVVILYFS
jgi:hypothetical protein